MNRYRTFWLVAGALLIGFFTSCTLPSGPTPFAIPTPNLTMTALFEPTETIPPSITPPAVQTATPVQVSPTPTVEEIATEIEATATSPLGTPAVPGVRSGPGVEAIFLETTPVIDGDLGEWNLDTYQVASVVFGAANHDDRQDLSGEMMIAWDEDHLFIAIQVDDDQYAQNATGELLYKGDSLEVLFDRNLESDFYTAYLSADDYQLGISPGKVVGDALEVYLWYPKFRAGSRPLVKVAASSHKDGYQVEMAIPWSVFDTTPVAGGRYGFAFSISDNDNTAQNVQQSMVSNVATRRLVDPTTWGNLTLLKP